MSHEGIRITEELSESAQRAVGIPPQRHETLGELVKDMARRADLRGEDPVSEQPTRHEVKVNGEILYTNCFGDALALPFVLQDEKFEVRSESPIGGEVRATVTKDGVEVSPPDAVMSFGATRVGDGPLQATACPYINAFPSREDYERWVEATPQTVTIALSLEDAFALVRDLVSGGARGFRGDGPRLLRSVGIERTEGRTMTNSVNLEDVARAMAAADPDLDADGQRIFVQTFRLLARGEPVSPAEIADTAGVPTEQAEKRLRSWPLAFWDDHDRVVSFWGLAIGRLEPTHRIEVSGRAVYGWCAWDTLFITEILGTETHVESADPLSGEAIRLAVTPERVKEVRPEGAVVSFLRPDGPFGPDVVETFCHFVQFFASRESAERWMAVHPGTFLLSVDEAFELGRLTNRLRAPEVLGGGEVVR